MPQLLRVGPYIIYIRNLIKVIEANSKEIIHEITGRGCKIPRPVIFV